MMFFGLSVSRVFRSFNLGQFSRVTLLLEEYTPGLNLTTI